MKVIRPQPGPQEKFLASPADIVIYGGGAGGGKTWALLMESTRHISNKEFGAVFFRRNSTQIRNEGGLWDESINLYQPLGAESKESTLDWKFPSGASISFRHLEYEKNKYDWQGSQICLECFDELTHFTANQFWYMVTRNRSTCGIRPYIRATCNPDPDSWVAELISWWINPDTGLPIPERSGILRWFIRIGNAIKWADNPEALAGHTMANENGDEVPIPPKSLTFIPALVTDNKVLMRDNPDYLANLMAQPTVERERLMNGNWKVRAIAGMFRREDAKIVDIVPKLVRVVRAWDLAATEITDNGARPAATVGLKMGVCEQNRYYINDVVRDWLGAADVIRLIQKTASQDGRAVKGSIPQDPGQAGKAQKAFIISELPGYDYHATPETGDKVTRAMPFLAQWEAGNVMMVRAPWNDALISELVAFPGSELKDQVDAASRAFNELIAKQKKKVKIQLRQFG